MDGPDRRECCNLAPGSGSSSMLPSPRSHRSMTLCMISHGEQDDGAPWGALLRGGARLF